MAGRDPAVEFGKDEDGEYAVRINTAEHAQRIITRVAVAYADRRAGLAE